MVLNQPKRSVTSLVSIIKQQKNYPRCQNQKDLYHLKQIPTGYYLRIMMPISLICKLCQKEFNTMLLLYHRSHCTTATLAEA